MQCYSAWRPVLAVLVVSAFAFGGSLLAFESGGCVFTFASKSKEEEDGLDLSQHGEEAYNLD